MTRCPACQRAFESGGFCPYDGTPLATGPDQPTIGGEQFRAISAKDGAKDRARAGSEAGARTPVIRPPAPIEYDQLIGQTLDARYRILRKIGEGGMGVVYDARHVVIERPLAIKVLRREVMRDGASIKRFVQEARAASRIGHPSIVDVTDFGTTPDGMTYSVMEYIDGDTLAKAIKADTTLAVDRAIPIAVQIARALGAAHDKGIVHRDLKPENVFLTQRDGRPDFVKIVDFGIAKVQPVGEVDPEAPRLTRAGSVFGTPEYMAPEQAAGRGDTDHRVDIYALGTILYEMATGRVPLKGPSLIATVAMQMLDPIPELPPSVPAPLARVIVKALAKSRDERYQTMSELAVALDAALGEVRGQIATPAAPDARTLAPLSSPSPSSPSRRARPLTRPLHEPEFVTGGRLLELPEPAPEEPLPPPPRRRSLALAALLLVGSGGAIAWWWQAAQRPAPSRSPAPPVGAAIPPVGAAPRDAGTAIATAPRDASVVIAPVAPIAPADAAAIAPAPDAHAAAAIGRAPTAPLAPLAPLAPGELARPHPAKVTVEIMTRPAAANVFVGDVFLGPSGVRHTESWGTTLSIECRAPHMAGKATIVFDGKRDAVMCTAVRIPMCVAGLKNPIDKCDP